MTVCFYSYYSFISNVWEQEINRNRVELLCMNSSWELYRLLFTYSLTDLFSLPHVDVSNTNTIS